MAIQEINIGTGPNTGSGEPIRDAFGKVNSNFTEVSQNLSSLGLDSSMALKQIGKVANPDWVVQNPVNTTTVQPDHHLNYAYPVAQAGTIWGLTVVIGDWIVDNGAAFSVKKSNDKIVQIESDVNLKTERLIVVEDKVSRLYPYGQIFYGVERERGSADPAFTPIGNADQHTSLPIHRMIRPCKVNSNRKIVNYLQKANWNYNEDGTASVLDGSDGQDVMLQFPKCWMLLGGSNATYERWIVSDGPFTYEGDQAIEIKSFVQSPDYCTIDVTGKSRCVRNETADYAGSGSNYTAGGLGYPRTSRTRYQYETAAWAKGEGWNPLFYRDRIFIAGMMYIEYKTKNLKAALGSSGPSNWSSENWSGYNGYNPVRKMLETQLSLSGTSGIISLGEMTGIYNKTFNFVVGGNNVSYNTPFLVWRGLNMLWGDLWSWYSGIDLEVQSDAAGGKSTIYVQFDPEQIDQNQSDSNFAFKDNYAKIGLAPRGEGWVKDIYNQTIYSKTFGGGETTYGCAYIWNSNLPASGTVRRGVICGADLDNGGSAALGASHAYCAPSLADPAVGGGFRADVNE